MRAAESPGKTDQNSGALNDAQVELLISNPDVLAFH